MPSRSVATWVLRGLWVVAPFVAGPALGQALEGRAGALPSVGTALAWALWFVALVAMLVPSTVALTAVRSIVPVLALAGVVSAVAGAGALAAGAATALGGAATVVALSAPVTGAFVQASAYGDEARFALRIPGPLLLGPLELAWLAMAVGGLAGPLLLADHQWVLGGVALVIGVPVAYAVVRRLHRMGLRWLVLVPAGLVVHDPLALHDTAMFPSRDVAGLALAVVGTDALDLTAGAPGMAVEVTLRDLSTVVLAGTMAKREGTAVHVRSFLLAPLRPGEVLAEATRRRLPVG